MLAQARSLLSRVFRWLRELRTRIKRDRRGTTTPTVEESVSRPTITPIGGDFTGLDVADVTIVTSTSGATIYYTTDGAVPDATDTEYTAPFTISEDVDGGTVTVRAIGIKSGLLDSAIAGETYTWDEPVTPPAGSWDTRTMRDLPTDGTFSTWDGPDGAYRIVGATDGTSAPTHSTIAEAIAAWQSGEWILLREAIYWETDLNLSAGMSIASYPGEIATVAFCIQEAYDDPASFWEPVVGGAPDEFQSADTFSGVGGVAAWIAATMIPLQVANPDAFEAETEVAPNGPKDSIYYGGPCVRYDTTTDRIHVRLSHTTLDFLSTEDRWGLGGDYNWEGETDAQLLPMFVGRKVQNTTASAGNLRLHNNVTVRDLVVIGGGAGGSGEHSIEGYGRSNITLDNVWLYPGITGVRLTDCPNPTVQNCKLHGLAAPWSSRGWMKYNGADKYNILFNRCPGAVLTRCEIVDGHDLCRFDGNPPGSPAGDYEVSFNLFEHGNDDMLFMPGHDAGIKDIYGNIFRGCASTIPTTGSSQETEAAGDGVFFHHNYIDRRRGAFGGPPRSATTETSLYYANRAVPDQDGSLNITHGGDYPERIRLHFYHNTIVSFSPAGLAYHRGLGGKLGNSETYDHNNIFVLIVGTPREDLDGGEGYPFTYERSHNIAYSLEDTTFEGVIALEIYENPRLVHLSTDRFDPDEDLRLASNSPCLGAGMELDASWPMLDFTADTPAADPLDVGAIPFGVAGPLTRILGPGSEL